MPFHPAGPALGLLLALLCLWWSLRQRRRHRLLRDLPTSRVRGVFIGLVELQGTAESPSPLSAPFSSTTCVHHAWTIEEHYRRTRTETYTDSKGNSQTRTVTDTGWDTVATGGETQDFYLRDSTGTLLVRPAGARLEPLRTYSETHRRGHSLYYGLGPDAPIRGSTGERRFTEHSIPLHAPLYVIGTARERSDIVAPELAAAPASEFIISCRPEHAITRGLALGSWAAWLLGLAALPLGLHLGDHFAPGLTLSPDRLIAFSLLTATLWLAAWLLGWIWMVHDSLISLRARVRQGWSLIDVQLKRRHDLIPALAATVSALSTHEKDTQVALAALRAQSTATRPGQPGPDPSGLAPTLRVIVEKYPSLTADPAFAALHHELVETEQRIALARAYYNDIATHYATRLEIIPDRFIAALRSLRPEPLLAATDFERAPVQVTLAP